ncbi:MAG: YkgJ family cysteine cluster protein [Planctomycetota bacterium]
MAKKVRCDRCTGLCCRYFALPIETPESREDYEDIRWYLCHEDITVFVDDNDWYLNVKNKCRHINSNTFKCDIYSKRPRICLGYKTDDCDLTEGEYGYDLHFTNDKDMEEYIKVKFDNNIAEKRKNRKKSGKKKKK